ncbi:hypothetical protein D9615_010156 [Tricholomella constricta]|uniref:Uncharacterized protein n=1 Tax=Tricholomella constricta TaxID=117010 RepID=A0A8H5GR62_9AGAR|nr:hypothetical protein D9615_010156 [Tricholomella constricta]
MASAFLSSLFCCCTRNKEEEHDIPDERGDETSRLIPGPTTHSNPAMIDHQRLQQKFGTIVRAKERKMVNVGSRIPFNLHNQLLPPEPNHTLSRSASGTMHYFDATDDYGAGMYYAQPYPPAPYPRFTTSASPDPYDHTPHSSRSGSLERGANNTHSILNVRLVGFVDRRGRTPQRKRSDVGFDFDLGTENTPTLSSIHHAQAQARAGSGTESPSAIASSDKAKLQGSGAISLSWGD